MNTNEETKSRMSDVINRLNANNTKSKENGTPPVRPAVKRSVEPSEPRVGVPTSYVSRPATPKMDSNEFATIGEYKVRVSAVELSRATSEGVYLYMASGATVAFLVGGVEYDDALELHETIDQHDMNP